MPKLRYPCICTLLALVSASAATNSGDLSLADSYYAVRIKKQKMNDDNDDEVKVFIPSNMLLSNIETFINKEKLERQMTVTNRDSKMNDKKNILRFTFDFSLPQGFDKSKSFETFIRDDLAFYETGQSEDDDSIIIDFSGDIEKGDKTYSRKRPTKKTKVQTKKTIEWVGRSDENVKNNDLIVLTEHKQTGKLAIISGANFLENYNKVVVNDTLTGRDINEDNSSNPQNNDTQEGKDTEDDKQEGPSDTPGKGGSQTVKYFGYAVGATIVLGGIVYAVKQVLSSQPMEEPTVHKKREKRPYRTPSSPPST